MTRWVIIFVLIYGSYILFVGPFSFSEALAAIPAVLGGFGFAILQHRNAARRLAVHAPWRRLVAYLAATLAKDTVRVGGALLRTLVKPVSGRIAAQAFNPGNDDANAAGRRAAVILAVSLAPNGYVVGVTDNSLQVHRLFPAPSKPDTVWPL